MHESVISADKDNVPTFRTKLYSLPKSTADICDANFSNLNRIKVLGCVHASGDIGRPMFVFQGTRRRYRKLQTSRTRQASHLQTIADCLRRGALVATRKDVASVDKINFDEWARRITGDMNDLTANGRKLLLLYDGYRSHTCVQALELFKKNIVAFALPAHASGVTKPLDLSVFNPGRRTIASYLRRNYVGGNP